MEKGLTGVSSHRLCVAPMMDWTDRHDRFFLRLISRHARLYTEMLTTGAVIHGDRARLLGFSREEHPVALQLGGADPAAMAQAAAIGQTWGYDEININCGCPSDRVQAGRFGACLMAEPDVVAACAQAMQREVDVPVTVKTRIGIDADAGDERLSRFVDTVAGAGVRVFIVHARKAWLKGLSPKENREKPPLDYAMVRRLKVARPDLSIILNGGVETLDQAEDCLADLDGVMIGRAAYQSPYMLAEADRRLFDPSAPVASRAEIVERLIGYIERQTGQGVPLAAITRHILGLFAGVPGARAWRRHLSEEAHRPGADASVVRAALARAEASAAAVAQAA
ncbi:MAG: tRNA dihydrouridine(20/20a) synthase DusA [Rhodospirillaceae bacterium]|nr:tRNA dihydrouridine(20/20a) synthase DusA [Rhodospirillaceae bacterium]